MIPVDPNAPDELAFQAALAIYRAGTYAEAVNAWTEFLADFPQSVRADNAQYLLAQSHYKLMDCTAAAQEFQALIQGYPATTFKDNAEYFLGRCDFKAASYQTALNWFQTSLMTDPSGTYADNSQYYVGRSLFELGDRAGAIPELEKVLTDFPQSTYLDNATYYLGRSHFGEASYAQARERFVGVLGFADSSYREVAQYYLGRTEYALGNLDAALAELQAVKQQYPTSVYIDNADYRIVVIYLDRSDCAAANSLLTQMQTDYPGSSYTTDAATAVQGAGC